MLDEKQNNHITFSREFNPRTQPVVETPQTELLLPQTLTLDFIQHAFAKQHKWQVEPIYVRSFPTDFTKYAQYKPAAVFLPIVQNGDDLSLLFTKRAQHLQNHAGQICFPGGRAEATDKNSVDTALREMHEEIGVHPRFINLMGTHPSFITTSRFIMEPVIGSLKPGFSIVPDSNEVEQVFDVPLSVLMDPSQHVLHSLPVRVGYEKFYFSMTWQQHFIWGATAALVRNFYWFLLSAQKHLKP